MNPIIDIITPNSSPRNYTAVDREKEEAFTLHISTILELPTNWENYLTFRFSNSFITLQDNSSYNALVFRRFKRGKIVVIPDDLKQNVQEYIKRKTDWANEVQTIEQRNEKYRELVKEHLIPFNSDTLLVVYQTNNDMAKCYVRIVMTVKEEPYLYKKDVGTIVINHAGQISKPTFPHSFSHGSNITIETVLQWIEEKKQLAITLYSIAHTVKAALPQDFFIPTNQ